MEDFGSPSLEAKDGVQPSMDIKNFKGSKWNSTYVVLIYY